MQCDTTHASVVACILVRNHNLHVTFDIFGFVINSAVEGHGKWKKNYGCGESTSSTVAEDIMPIHHQMRLIQQVQSEVLLTEAITITMMKKENTI